MFYSALDYTEVSRTITLDSTITTVEITIDITDNTIPESDERFEIMLTSLNDNCIVTNSSVPVYITDDDGTFHIAIFSKCKS